MEPVGISEQVSVAAGWSFGKPEYLARDTSVGLVFILLINLSHGMNPLRSLVQEMGTIR